MKIKITLLFILFLIQSNAQQITWNKKYFQPIKHFNAAISINQLPDSGFIILANKYNVGSYGKVIRTNKYGDSIWVKIIEVTQKLITTYDNGFMLSGYDGNGSFLKKLNSNGDTI
ncbi:MAG: hypothetical protein JNK61_11865 [Bacteroidia bacterium]|nr:hypothetical protein [Bacteroidia bacterium]HQV00368.1 hypothetical protein [Bacteroidia bacterium]